MNRGGTFVLGLMLGVMVMQVGMALYLRSTDWAIATFYTFVASPLAIGAGAWVAEEWQ